MHFETIPLSFAQERLWFLNQLTDNKGLYNITDAYILSGELNIEALEHGFNAVIQRHESLRTIINVNNNIAMQKILSPADTYLKISAPYDISSNNAKERIDKIIADEYGHAFDLQKWPLIRVILIKKSQNKHILVINMHHIVSDGWSISIITSELSTFYNDYCLGNKTELPELSIQYGDFSIWQRELLKGKLLEKQINYWKEFLQHSPLVLNLPYDKPRPRIQTYAGNDYHFKLSSEEYTQLKRLSKTHDVTMFMLLLAVFQVLLYRYSHQEDIVVGSPVANRHYPGVKDIVGFFVNTLVFRADFSNDICFIQFLKQVRDVALNAYENQDVPFEQVVEAMQVDRDLSRHPIFQVMFMFQDQDKGSETIQFSHIDSSYFGLETNTSKFDLTLSIKPNVEDIELQFEYSTDLFEKESIENLSQSFLCIIRDLIVDPNKSINKINIISNAKQNLLLNRWNNTATFFNQNQCVHDLFELQASKTPDAIALQFNDSLMTYKELNQRANQLAYFLISKDLQSPSLIGICLERSFEMVISLIATLKIGAAYVPLDPNHPALRINYILKDSGASILITTEELSGKFAEFQGNLICFDLENKDNFLSVNNILSPVNPTDLAYIIYTSGTTGNPKGVMVTHSNLVNLLHAMQVIGLKSTDTMAALTTITFDIAGLEIYLPLITGARIVIIPQNKINDSFQLARFLETNNINVFQATPSTYHLLEAANWEPKQSVKLLCGGESLSKELANFLLKKATCVWHVYGPTETTIWSTFTKVESAETIYIGKPIANTKIYILDKNLQLVPIGVVGELYISGMGVAKGYYQRPELTAERFIENPFVADPAHHVLYKTGDLACYSRDGNIQFIGRNDHQIKFRGHRIELGEIESALLMHNCVKQSLAIFSEAAQLIAYVVLDNVENRKQANDKIEAELINYLKQKLPEYMLPLSIVIMTSFPISASGKIDRTALLLPNNKISNFSKIAGTTTEFETKIAEIWKNLLLLENIDINDNFFKVGGHSLLAAVLIGKIRDTYNIELPLQSIFKSPTIKDLAIEVENLVNSACTDEEKPITNISRERPISLSSSQQRLWFIFKMLPDSNLYNVPVALNLFGKLNIDNFHAAIEYLFNRHEILRTIYSEVNGSPTQSIQEDQSAPFEYIDLRQISPMLSQDEINSYINHESETVFDISKEIPIRMKLLKVNNDQHIFLLVMHHIATDAQSIDIFLYELFDFYNQLQSNELIALPSNKFQYADYAFWQKNLLNEEKQVKQKNYWIEQLRDIPEQLNLPFDRERPDLPSYKGASYRIELPTNTLDKLRILAKKHNATVFMTLLAIYNVLLYRYSNQEDIVVGTAIANRHYPEVENMLGLFINSLSLRSKLHVDMSFEDLLTSTKKMTLAAYSNQDVPFESILDTIKVRRNHKHHPVFQTMLISREQKNKTQIINGLKATLLEPELPISKFDLTLYAYQVEDTLQLEFEYAVDLFDLATIERLAQHFRNLTVNIINNPQEIISKIPLLSPNEREQLIENWNQTKKTYKVSDTIHKQFEKIVDKHPHLTALIFNEEAISYLELNERANRLAHYLTTMGITKNSFVVISLDRTPELIVSILGILKAGGAYVPIDSSYPKGRFDYILQDCQPQVVVTEHKYLDRFSQFTKPIICIDVDFKRINAMPSHNLQEVSSPTNLAYAIYTSGSTGNPKGVLIQHDNVIRLFHATEYIYNFSTNDTWLLFHSYAFDVSVWEMWGALFHGGKLIILSNNICKAPDALYKILNDYKVTVLNQTPSAGRQLFEYEKALSNPFKLDLRWIIFAGEVLNPGILESWFNNHGDNTRIANMYGITEGTIHVTFNEIKAIDVKKNYESLIGSALPDMALYVLDQHRNISPIGIVGELFVAGPGLAREYLNRQTLTNERFINNPLISGNLRLYKTGDLVKYKPDGNLQYIGRIDDQVKIRGYRIELGEIKIVLEKHELVKAALVLVKNDNVGHKYIAAYLCINRDLIITDDESEIIRLIRQSIKNTLPDYMLPQAFTIIESIPITEHGKINYRALPEPSFTNLITEKNIQTAQTFIEKAIIAIWCEILGLKQIGINDNFFDIGGHSLLLINLQNRIQNKFNINITVIDLFRYTTIEQLSKYIENGGIKTTTSAITARATQQRSSLQKKREKTHRNKVYDIIE